MARNYTDRLSIDQRRQLEENGRNPSAWAKAKKLGKVGKRKSRAKKPKRHRVKPGRFLGGSCTEKCQSGNGCEKPARFLCIDGKYRCDKCYKRFKWVWVSENVKGRKQSEEARRRAIFAAWRNPELAAFRQTPEYQEWRVQILERDKYICQHCQKTGGKLHVHHIKSARSYPKQRLDVENGVVLCRECHEDLHIARYDKKMSGIIQLQA